jgi:hypothetical protein
MAPDEYIGRDVATRMYGSFHSRLAALRNEGLGRSKPEVKDVKLSIDALGTHLKDIINHQSLDAGVDEALSLEWKNQCKVAWQSTIGEELRGIEEVPLQFDRYLRMQRRKWAERRRIEPMSPD